jgi:hypothetical protein
MARDAQRRRTRADSLEANAHGCLCSLDAISARRLGRVGQSVQNTRLAHTAKRASRMCSILLHDFVASGSSSSSLGGCIVCEARAVVLGICARRSSQICFLSHVYVSIIAIARCNGPVFHFEILQKQEPCIEPVLSTEPSACNAILIIYEKSFTTCLCEMIN